MKDRLNSAGASAQMFIIDDEMRTIQEYYPDQKKEPDNKHQTYECLARLIVSYSDLLSYHERRLLHHPRT